MAKFNLDDYTTVDERIEIYSQDNPDYRVYTEVIGESENGEKIRIKATLYKNGDDLSKALFHSTGIASETYEGYVNKTSRDENCETSAIGRALANAGYTGKGGRPSREEMAKVERLTDNESKPKTEKKKEEPEPKDEVSSDDEDSFVEKMESFTDLTQFMKFFNGEMSKREGKELKEFQNKYLSKAREIMTNLENQSKS